MSFGFGVQDFLNLYDRTRAVIEACRDGPPELRELSREVETLQITISKLKDDAQDPTSLLVRKGQNRQKDMTQILSNCREILDEVQTFVDKHSTLAESANSKSTGFSIKRVWDAYQVGSEDLDSMRGKLTFYTSTINLFIDSLSSAALGRIEQKMDMILANLMTKSPQLNGNLPDDAQSILSLSTAEPDPNAWKIIRTQLLAAGVSETDIDDHKDRIVDYVVELVTNTLSSDTAATSREAERESSLRVTLQSEDRRKIALQHLGRFATRLQLLGKASLDYRITHVQYGTYGDEPACLVVADFGFNSVKSSQLIEGDIYWLLFGEELDLPSKKASDSLPALYMADFAPRSAEGSFIQVSRPNHQASGAVTTPASLNSTQTPAYFQTADIETRVGSSGNPPRWSVDSSMNSRQQGILWDINGITKNGGFLDGRIKVAAIIRHDKKPFSMSISHGGMLKSSLRRLMRLSARDDPEIVYFKPEDNETVLDEIDLHALISGPDI